MNIVRIGDLLTRRKDAVVIEDDAYYRRVTIKTKNQGILLRDIEIGSNIGTKNQFILKKGQFLLSKIDARYGAFGVVPDELENAIITGNFWSFDVDTTRLNIEWFHLYTSSSHFIEICNQSSSGTTNRRYLDEEKFLNYEIILPNILEQNKMIEWYKLTKGKFVELDEEVETQSILVGKLRQSILQEAFQGELVPQDQIDEPARVLLEKIKAEKEQLIKEKKIKKEKPLPEITDLEIPYELPQGWKWVRFGEICKSVDYGTSTKASSENIGVPVLRMNNVINGKIDFTDLKYVEEGISDLPRLYLEAGDLLFNRTNSYDLVGKTGIFTDPSMKYTFASYLIRCSIFLNFLNVKYVNYYMNSTIFRKTQLEPQITQQNGQANFNGSKLKETLVPIPPLREQVRIVQKVDQFMVLCDELKKTLLQSKRNSEVLLQSVIQDAFNQIKKVDNVVEFTSAKSNDFEDWEIAARSDGEIDSETKVKIKNRVTELLGKSQQ
ncbi:restriction endonuclease subunit S [Paenibacillus puerhi]|uniref:restriction endonuclease subunit S n=1 Tax=Paenibacillus puerhi TaxID=2692622 RepID=UPI0013598A36|nr:restriction endonuclease subunit S [Paenibacillus puerhi]